LCETKYWRFSTSKDASVCVVIIKKKRPYRRLNFELIQNHRPFDSLPQYKKNQPDEMNTMNKVNVEEMLYLLTIMKLTGKASERISYSLQKKRDSPFFQVILFLTLT